MHRGGGSFQTRPASPATDSASHAHTPCPYVPARKKRKLPLPTAHAGTSSNRNLTNYELAWPRPAHTRPLRPAEPTRLTPRSPAPPLPHPSPTCDTQAASSSTASARSRRSPTRRSTRRSRCSARAPTPPTRSVILSHALRPASAPLGSPAPSSPTPPCLGSPAAHRRLEGERRQRDGRRLVRDGGPRRRAQGKGQAPLVCRHVAGDRLRRPGRVARRAGLLSCRACPAASRAHRPCTPALSFGTRLCDAHATPSTAVRMTNHSGCTTDPPGAADFLIPVFSKPDSPARPSLSPCPSCVLCLRPLPPLRPTRTHH